MKKKSEYLQASEQEDKNLKDSTKIETNPMLQLVLASLSVSLCIYFFPTLFGGLPQSCPITSRPRSLSASKLAQ